jgi:hypothetical protein
LHAVSGAGPASLLVEKGRPRLPSSFAKPSGYQVFRPGQVRLRLILNGQSSPLASETVRLGPGRHTVVAVGGDNGVDLLVYRDDGVESGKATLRAIHAAGEVGDADVKLDGKVVVSGVGLGDATGYLPVPPGPHSVAVTKPGGKGMAIVKTEVRAVAGTASTAFVVGSGGMPAQIVLTEDGSAGPKAAPATGLGGATSGTGWLLILGSSLIGGSLGGASYLLARRTRQRGSLHVVETVVEQGTAEQAPSAPSAVAAGPPVREMQEEQAAEAERPTVVEEAVAEEAVVEEHVMEDTVEEPVAAEPVVESTAVEETAAPAEPAKPTRVYAAAPVPPLPPMPAKPAAPVAAAPANGNGGGHDEELPTPPLWTPPPSERWEASEPTGRFTRETPAEDEEKAPTPPMSRFTRPDPAPEGTAEPAPATPARLLFNGPPRVAGTTPEATERPLSPWPAPAAEPYPPAPTAQPEPAPEAVDPVAADTDESWTGSWIAEPAAEAVPAAETPEAPGEDVPEPPATFTPAEPAEEATTAPAPLWEPFVAAAPQPEPELEIEVELEEPVAAEPVPEEPAAEAEVVEAEVVEAEVVEAEVVEEPAVAEPVAEAPDAPEPPAPFVHPVWAPKPVAEEPVADEPAPAAEPVAEAEVADEPAPVNGNAVSTWSSTSARPGSATRASGTAGKVSFLVVSGAALVVTGLVAARRGGRHH